MTGRRDVVGLDASILMHPKVWKAVSADNGHCDGPALSAEEPENSVKTTMVLAERGSIVVGAPE